ncbi:hypothetical protein PanWU01x14_308850 [Parasponia andersonii]|uniref:DUF4220 domain-containing protein n=1 Tax=Parasponia andersonii TaxID=3476 RepID=A0A2P5AQT4_PARAD|nr:hypothetical protein PanWU01x14_308850 [Parasponia andersonii]
MNSHRVVFRVIEIELGFVYDLFYTKADFIYSPSGGICRVLSFLLTVIGFVGFLSIDKQAYPRVDVSITYVLLVGAIALEIYAAVMLLCSDWTRHWLSKHKNPVVLNLYRAISLFSPPQCERWSNYIAQYNLISFSLKNEPSKWSFLQMALCIRQTMEKHRYKTFHGVTEELKELIFQQLRQKTRTNTTHVNSSFGVWKDLCAKRGQGVLEKEGFLVKFGWSIEEAEFDQSILLWHIATDLCYYDESTVLLDPTENSNFQPNDAN